MKLNRAESRLNCEISISRKLFEIYSDRSLEEEEKISWDFHAWFGRGIGYFIFQQDPSSGLNDRLLLIFLFHARFGPAQTGLGSGQPDR